MSFSGNKGDSPLLPERPGGCFAQKGTVPFVSVVSVNVSLQKGTVKHPVGRIEIDAQGVVGDAHAGSGHRQVSLLSREIIDRFSAETGRAVGPGSLPRTSRSPVSIWPRWPRWTVFSSARSSWK